MSVLEELTLRGFRVWLMDGKVRIFPRALLTDDVRRLIADNREALVRELEASEAGLPMPYINDSGDLVIPFDSPRRYHWWAGGQSVGETLRELCNRHEPGLPPDATAVCGSRLPELPPVGGNTASERDS